MDHIPAYLEDLANLRDAGMPPREIIYRALVRCAQRSAPCPHDGILADLAGLEALSSVVYNIRCLERANRIACKSYQRGRDVTITLTGKSTRPIVNPKPHWRERLGPLRVDSNYVRAVAGAVK